MKSPKVSIVMAAYNEEKHIAAAMRSMLAQTFGDFEFIIINDGSGDGTEDVIKTFKDPRIVYIRNEKNLGLIGSLNRGLKAAKGEYIARMDADDESYGQRLEVQVRFMDTHPAIGLSGAQLQVFGAGQGMMHYPLTHEAVCLRLLITSAFGNNVVIFRRALLEDHGLYFPEGYYHAEDYKCWTKWVRVTQCVNLDETLVRYRSHSASVSVKNRQTQRQTRNRVRAEYLMETFGVTAALAAQCVDKPGSGKRAALQELLRLNEEKMLFDDAMLKQTLAELWYLDSLELAESSLSACLNYRHIFKIGAGNYAQWLNVLKHYIKFRAVNDAARASGSIC